MFVSFITAIVMLLLIMTYLSSSSLVVDASKVKLAFEKTKQVFSIEKVIADSVENLCQSNATLCVSKYSGGVINLNFSDLSGYIPVNLVNDNLYGGAISIQIRDNNTTIRLTHTLSDPVTRTVYLKHYQGRMYGIPPKCVSGVETTTPPCSSSDVYHDYPTSIETRAAL